MPVQEIISNVGNWGPLAAVATASALAIKEYIAAKFKKAVQDKAVQLVEQGYGKCVSYSDNKYFERVTNQQILSELGERCNAVESLKKSTSVVVDFTNQAYKMLNAYTKTDAGDSCLMERIKTSQGTLAGIKISTGNNHELFFIAKAPLEQNEGISSSLGNSPSDTIDVNYQWEVHAFEPKEGRPDARKSSKSLVIDSPEAIGRLKYFIEDWMKQATHGDANAKNADLRLQTNKTQISGILHRLTHSYAELIFETSKDSIKNELEALYSEQERAMLPSFYDQDCDLQEMASNAPFYTNALTKIAPQFATAATLTNDEVKTAITHYPTQAREVVSNLEYLASLVDYRDHGLVLPSDVRNLHDSMNVIPIDITPVDTTDEPQHMETPQEVKADFARHLVEFTNNHAATILETAGSLDRNQFRVFASCAPDAEDSLRQSVYQNNMTWTKNEILASLGDSYSDEMRSAIDKTLEGLLSEREPQTSLQSPADYMKEFATRLSTDENEQAQALGNKIKTLANNYLSTPIEPSTPANDQTPLRAKL